MKKINKELEKDKIAIAVLKNGITSAFWNVMKELIQDKIDYLQQQILENDELSEEVKITKRDLARKYWQLNKWLLNEPERLIKDIEEGKDAKKMNWDPYE